MSYEAPPDSDDARAGPPPTPDRRLHGRTARSLPFGTLEFVLLLAVSIGVAAVWIPWRATDVRRADEARAIETIRRIAAAQGVYRTAAVARVGPSAEFATLADLARAGLLVDPVVADDPVPHLDVGGYRVEVLRPERLEINGRVRWTRGAGRVDPSLAPIWFAVTAIPRRGADLGLRSFYIDSKGRLFAAEGVQDADRDPSRAPPARELIDDREEMGEGPIWRLETTRATAAK